MKTQEYQDMYQFRIKFAAMTDQGYLNGDAFEEYDALFQHLPDEWLIEETGLVTVGQSGQHRSWLLRHESHEIVAVEHETGVEILISIGVNIASTVIIEFTAWAWKRWRDSRARAIVAGHKVEPSLHIESVEERFPDGRSRVTRRLEIRGPLTETEVEAAIKKWG